MSMGELTKGQNVQLPAVRVSTCSVVHATGCGVSWDHMAKVQKCGIEKCVTGVHFVRCRRVTLLAKWLSGLSYHKHC